jgi:hypothetical protein
MPRLRSAGRRPAASRVRMQRVAPRTQKRRPRRHRPAGPSRCPEAPRGWLPAPAFPQDDRHAGPLWKGAPTVPVRDDATTMSSTPRSSTPITSAAELSVWWAEVLSESDFDAPRLSMMWLDDRGRMLARVLSIDGVPPLPHRTVVQAVLQIHGAFAERPEAADCHLAYAFSRPGDATVVDEERVGGGPPYRAAGASRESVELSCRGRRVAHSRGRTFDRTIRCPPGRHPLTARAA